MPESTATLVERYLAAIVDPRASAEVVGAMLHPEMLFVEQPNMFNPGGSQRDRATVLESLGQGHAMIGNQRFEVRDHYAVDDSRLVTRAQWSGECAIDLGPLPAGTRFRADSAMFFEFRDGLIYRQENFDCFALPELPADTAE